MKVFLAYKFTGENPVQLKKNMTYVCGALTEAGHNVFCTVNRQDFYDQNHFTAGQIICEAFERLDESDALVAFLSSPEKSEGMLLEVGYALSKGKKLILLVRKGVPSVHLYELADLVIEYDALEELPTKLPAFNRLAVLK